MKTTFRATYASYGAIKVVFIPPPKVIDEQNMR